ncbi:hypothetical protein D3C80_1888710 [compost metagenome]
MSYICGWNASEKSAQFKLASQTSRHVTTTVYSDIIQYKLVQYLNERQVSPPKEIGIVNARS